MNCIIIDDESTARAIIERLCESMAIINVVGQFPNAIQGIKYLNENNVDLIFLDIHMPDFSGFDFIKTLKDPPNIIVTTSDKNYALEAFEYPFIVDYLIKPVVLERFEKAVLKAKQNPAKTNPLSYAQGCARVFSTRARLARSEWTVRAGARKAAQGFSRAAQGLRSSACDVKKLCKACASLFSSRARLWACFSTLKSLGEACAKIFSRRARLGACFSACRALGCWGVESPQGSLVDTGAIH